MTDLASLGIKIDSTQAKTAAADLDKLSAAGARAQAATVGLGKGTATAGAAATAMAAQAQLSARAAVGMATGAGTASAAMSGLASNTHASSLQIRESLVLMREAASGNFTRMAGSASLLAGSLATTGTSVGTFAIQLLTMARVLKTTQDAEAAEEAANASAAATALRSAAERAQAGIAAADTELALAEAAARVATTAEAETAALAQATAAHEAMAASAAEAAIAENALGVAMGREAETAAASAAATTIALGPVAFLAAGLIAAAGAVAALTHEANNDSGLKTYTTSMGYTAKEVEKLNAVSVTFGDTARAVFQVGLRDIASALGVSTTQMASAWDSFLDHLARATRATLAGIYAGFATLGKLHSVEGLGDIIASGKGNPITGVGVVLQREYAKSQKFFDDVEGQAKKNAGDRQTKMASEAFNAPRAARTSGGSNPGDHGNADALKELDAQIKGQQDLADAYLVSDAAAVQATAMQKAEEEAIRHKGVVALFYQKELALAVAKQTADGAKTIAGLTVETAARKKVNDEVAAGTLDASDAAQALRDEAQLRPHIIDYELADAAGKLRLTKIIQGLTAAQAANNAEEKRSQSLAQAQATDQATAQIEKEIGLTQQLGQERSAALKGLYGTSLEDELARINAEREKGLNTLHAEAEAEKLRAQGLNEAADAVLRQAAASNQLVDVNTTLDKQAAVLQERYGARQSFLAEVNKTPDQINAAIDGIKIDGLNALNQGLVDAITGTKSLGAAFHQAAAQILADLLKLAIEQTIVKTLGNVLGLGLGGGSIGTGNIAQPNFSSVGSIDGLSGLSFGGGRASGGSVSPGSIYAVNERSTAPGLFLPLAPGIIQPAGAGANDNSAPAVQVHISNDFRGADPAAVAAINGRLDRMQRELPGTIVTTMQDAKARFVWRGK